MRQHGGKGAAAHPHSSGEDSSSSDDEDGHDFLPMELDGRDPIGDSARACDGDEPPACGVCDGAAPLALPTPMPVRRTRRTDAMLSFSRPALAHMAWHLTRHLETRIAHAMRPRGDG